MDAIFSTHWQNKGKVDAGRAAGYNARAVKMSRGMVNDFKYQDRMGSLDKKYRIANFKRAGRWPGVSVKLRGDDDAMTGKGASSRERR